MSKFLKLLIACVAPLLFCCCHKPEIEDVDEGFGTGEPKKVLILGNSITVSYPLPNLGWQGAYGMAASDMDSDFVHILIRNIKERNDTSEVEFGNISSFEKNYTSYNFQEVDSIRNKKYDVIIMRIAENVSDFSARSNNFILYFDRLINYIDPGQHAVKVITNGYWPAYNTNALLKDYAISKQYQFVDLSPLYYQPGSTAVGLFPDTGVASHPGNKGMRDIANTIWKRIKKNF